MRRARVGLPVALKLSSPALLHKTEAGALALDLRDRGRGARRGRRGCSPCPRRPGATLLVERMAGDGVELIFAVRRDGVVPALLVGDRRDLGGGARRRRARPPPRLARRGSSAPSAACARAPLLTGARGGPAVDLAAAARFGSRLGELALEHDLDLLEVNPALASPAGCVALDAVAIRPLHAFAWVRTPST